MEGVDLKLWDFADQKAGWPLLWRYRQERNGNFSPSEVQAAMREAERAPPVKMTPRRVPAPDKEDQKQGNSAG
jgi:curli production assembly/transport component CsgG